MGATSSHASSAYAGGGEGGEVSGAPGPLPGGTVM